MEQFFIKDYTGAPFEIFGTAHLLALVVILAICLSFFYFRRVWGDQFRRLFRLGFAVFLLLSEISWHAWVLVYDEWTIQKMLPLHLCTVFVWLSMIMLITRSYPIYELSFFLGIGGALQALLTPDAGIYGFPHFRAFQTYFDHGGVFIAPIYFTIVEGYRPTLASFKRVVIWTNIYVAIVFIINLIIGSNYLFIAHKPDFPTLLDVLAPWPWYILQMELLGLTMVSLLYLPFALIDLKASRSKLIKPVQ